MKFNLYKSICLVSFMSLSAYTYAAETPSSTLTPAQQAEVKTIVQDYMTNQQNLLLMVSNINKAMMDKQQEATKQATAANAKELFYAADSVIAGNPKGNVTLVEFFDYTCPYCKVAAPGIEKMITDNNNLRVVFKIIPLPNHGEVAVFAAKAALASVQQSKFLPFHQALMASQGQLTDKIVLDIAKKQGLNIEKLQTDMNSPAITAQLKSGMELAGNIRLTGTPTMIVANVTPGKTPQDAPTLNKFIMVGDPSPQGLQTAINDVK